MSKFSNKRGFSLTEAIIAIAVLFIALVSVSQFFPLGLRVIGDSQKMTTASDLALAKIEELQALNYDLINTGVIEAKHRLAADPTDYLYSYQRQTEVEYVDANLQPAASDNGLKRIIVTVFWQSLIGSREKSVTLDSLTAKY